MRSPNERRAAVEAVTKIVQNVMECLQINGLSCGLVTGGGSGTYRIDAASGAFHEVQPGIGSFTASIRVLFTIT